MGSYQEKICYDFLWQEEGKPCRFQMVWDRVWRRWIDRAEREADGTASFLNEFALVMGSLEGPDET